MKSSTLLFSILLFFVLFLSCGTESTPVYTLTTSVVGEGTVDPDRGEFEEGETVTLSSKPKEGWVFNSWSGDGNGSSSTVTITMDGDKSVVGNFGRRDYPLTIIIEGEGTVEERVISSPKTTEYAYETVVNLRAVPGSDWGFLRWEGDINSEEIEINVTVEDKTTITVHFERVRCVQNFEPVDFSKSHEELFYIRYPLNPDGFVDEEILRELVVDLDAAEYGMNWISTDYNNDGIMDLVGMKFTWNQTGDREQGYTGYERKSPIKFFKGTCEGGFEEDPQNSGKYLGLVHPRKLLQGDFNKDGFVDFFFVGHGYDAQPFPGEFPKLLLSNGEGGFDEYDYKTEVAFFHGGTTGDFNNNGWLDVFLVEAGSGKSAIYLNNNGLLEPRRDLVNQRNTRGMLNVGWFDINNNGKLDLLLGGDDWAGEFHAEKNINTPAIILGNGHDFLGDIDFRLPPTSLPSQGHMTDGKVFDINGNGKNEIILARTGDPHTNPNNFYASWSLQILSLNEEGTYSDKTTDFIEDYHGSLERVGHDGPYWIDTWIPWLQIKEIDGRVILTNNKAPQWKGDHGEGYKEWTLQNGFFYRTR